MALQKDLCHIVLCSCFSHCCQSLTALASTKQDVLRLLVPRLRCAGLAQLQLQDPCTKTSILSLFTRLTGIRNTSCSQPLPLSS